MIRGNILGILNRIILFHSTPKDVGIDLINIFETNVLAHNYTTHTGVYTKISSHAILPRYVVLAADRLAVSGYQRMQRRISSRNNNT